MRNNINELHELNLQTKEKTYYKLKMLKVLMIKYKKGTRIKNLKK